MGSSLPNSSSNSKDLLHDIIETRGSVSSRYHGNKVAGSQQYGASATTTATATITVQKQ